MGLTDDDIQTLLGQAAAMRTAYPIVFRVILESGDGAAALEILKIARTLDVWAQHINRDGEELDHLRDDAANPSPHENSMN